MNRSVDYYILFWEFIGRVCVYAGYTDKQRNHAYATEKHSGAQEYF